MLMLETVSKLLPPLPVPWERVGVRAVSAECRRRPSPQPSPGVPGEGGKSAIRLRRRGDRQRNLFGHDRLACTAGLPFYYALGDQCYHRKQGQEGRDGECRGELVGVVV